MNYLDRFHRKLERRWKGSLISVAEAKAIEPSAKKYWSQLAGTSQVEKVTWGWCRLPDEYRDFFDFLAKDHHFKVLQKQSAAALWNGDFIHRDSFTVARMGLARRAQGARRRRCRCTSLTTSNAEIARSPHAPFGFRRRGGNWDAGAWNAAPPNSRTGS